MNRLVRAGLLTGMIDGLWAIILTIAYGRTILRLWQGIAAVPFGQGMLDGGLSTAALGVVMHFSVAFSWSAVFLLLVQRSAWLRRTIGSPIGTFGVAAVYGPLIWIVMSTMVIPSMTRQPVAITYRWWIQIAGHIVFVGLPIVWSLARDGRSST